MFGFKKQSRKAKLAYSVENLNPEKGIFSSMKEKEGKFITCLCITGKAVYTTFYDEVGAIEQMQKYRSLYKAKKCNK